MSPSEKAQVADAVRQALEELARLRAENEALRRRVGEALDILESIEWTWSDRLGDKSCPYCGARAFHTGDGPHAKHNIGCRIDAALQSKKKAKP